MFDIGFGELLLCLVVALIVIGPEQLPGTVRTVALWIGRLKRSLAETRSEIERQIGADDIRRQLHNEEILRNIEETRLQIEASIREHSLNNPDTYTAADEQGSRPGAADYGPPDELPDHAHTDQQANAPKAATTNPVTGNPAAGNNSINPPGNTQQATAATPAAHNNQQSQTPAAPAQTTTSTTQGAGQ